MPDTVGILPKTGGLAVPAHSHRNPFAGIL